MNDVTKQEGGKLGVCTYININKIKMNTTVVIVGKDFGNGVIIMIEEDEEGMGLGAVGVLC